MNFETNETNTVYYYLYRNIDHCNNIKDELDSLIETYYKHVDQYLKDYIWHNESFTLKSIVQHSSLYHFNFKIFFLTLI